MGYYPTDPVVSARQNPCYCPAWPWLTVGPDLRLTSVSFRPGFRATSHSLSLIEVSITACERVRSLTIKNLCGRQIETSFLSGSKSHPGMGYASSDGALLITELDWDLEHQASCFAFRIVGSV